MAQHISRKELKKDEFRDTLSQGANAVLSHRSLSIYILAAAIVVALGFFGWRTYTERQSVKASAAFDDAQKVFDAPVLGPGDSPTPGEPTYTDEKTKFSQASSRFADVAAKYPRTHPGQLALFYEALSQEKLENDAQAKKLLQSVIDAGNEEFAATAKLELAKLDDRAGQPDEAVKLFQDLIAKPTILVPKPVSMLALADHYSVSNPAEAAKFFNQIKSENPDTPIADEATQKLSLLPGKL